MTDKEAVRTVEPNACIQKRGDGAWLVCKHPEGQIIGTGKDGTRAWHNARMNLFGENATATLSEIPVAGK